MPSINASTTIELGGIVGSARISAAQTLNSKEDRPEAKSTTARKTTGRRFEFITAEDKTGACGNSSGFSYNQLNFYKRTAPYPQNGAISAKRTRSHGLSFVPERRGCNPK